MLIRTRSSLIRRLLPCVVLVKALRDMKVTLADHHDPLHWFWESDREHSDIRLH
ncbi:hypothetical protein HYDPIDRAFT_106033 [Hydnomerulius pinastri MD-312]|nr:hypothetical protein HYDPIDRAFT_106033 [Hydnomerulius pinastri MD-312]